MAPDELKLVRRYQDEIRRLRDELGNAAKHFRSQPFGGQRVAESICEEAIKKSIREFPEV